MKIKRTKGDLLRLREQLEGIDYKGASIKFKYTLSRNKDLLDQECKLIRKQLPENPQVNEYNAELDKINQKFSLKDESGAPKTVPKMLGGRLVPHYDIPDEMFVPGSEYKKETEELKKKYKEDLDKMQRDIQEYEKFLKDEEEVEVYGMIISCLPEGMSQEHSDALFPFIQDEPS